MNVKRVVIVSLVVFLVGCACGAGFGVIKGVKSSANSLPVASYGDLNSSEQKEVDKFVDEKENEHPDGADINVNDLYEQPEVDGNGNLVVEKPSSSAKEETSKTNEKSSKSNTASEKSGVVTVSESSSLRMRSGAGSNYDVLGALNKGDKVTILDESNGWYKIKTAKVSEAWVSKEYVSVE